MSPRLPDCPVPWCVNCTEDHVHYSRSHSMTRDTDAPGDYEQDRVRTRYTTTTDGFGHLDHTFLQIELDGIVTMTAPELLRFSAFLSEKAIAMQTMNADAI